MEYYSYITNKRIYFHWKNQNMTQVRWIFHPLNNSPNNFAHLFINFMQFFKFTVGGSILQLSVNLASIALYVHFKGLTSQPQNHPSLICEALPYFKTNQVPQTIEIMKGRIYSNRACYLGIVSSGCSKARMHMGQWRCAGP